MSKRNDNSDKFADWTTAKLKREAREYHDLIYGENACYGSHDIQIYEGILSELDNRGVTISNQLTFN